MLTPTKLVTFIRAHRTAIGVCVLILLVDAFLILAAGGDDAILVMRGIVLAYLIAIAAIKSQEQQDRKPEAPADTAQILKVAEALQDGPGAAIRALLKRNWTEADSDGTSADFRRRAGLA